MRGTARWRWHRGVASTLARLAVVVTLAAFCRLAFAVADSSHAAGNVRTGAPKEAYVSLLYGDYYVLPVRVMMRSLLVNSPDVAAGLRERLVLITGATSEHSVQQLEGDGVKTLRVDALNSPYKGDVKYHARFAAVMTKLLIFNLTTYDRLVFIDADALVLNDLTPLFSCGTFCATFINPCLFNSGLMLVTPNTTVFNDMNEKLPSTPSYDGGDQGFLNAYYPSLLDAPLFDYRAALPANWSHSQRPFMRLPFSWHFDHGAFYPGFGYDFEKSQRCGPRREIEWLGPTFTKPWLWWTYAFMDLSWTWHSYRKQLHDPYPLGEFNIYSALKIMIFTNLIIIAISRHMRTSQRPPPILFTTILPSLCPFPNTTPRLSCLISVMAGSGLWIVAFAASAFAVPHLLPPLWASAVFVCVRVLTTHLVILFHGGVFCVGQLAARRRTMRPNVKCRKTSFTHLLKESLAWSVFDALYLLIWAGILWQVAFKAMWFKLAVMIAIGSSQVVLVIFMFARMSAMWFNWADTLPPLADARLRR